MKLYSVAINAKLAPTRNKNLVMTQTDLNKSIVISGEYTKKELEEMAKNWFLQYFKDDWVTFGFDIYEVPFSTIEKVYLANKGE
jgi:hypothetical protein